MEHSTATAGEIADIIGLMTPVLKDVPEEHVFMACLAYCLFLINPDLETNELIAGVSATSEWMVDYLSVDSAVNISKMKFPSE